VKPYDKIVQLVYEAIADLNRTLEPQNALPLAHDTVLTGEGKLDSLAFLNLAIGIEERVERHFRKTISIMETALIADDTESLTVAALAARVAKIVERVEVP